MTAEAGWKDDPENSGQWRYWDGEQWTDHRSPKQSSPEVSAPTPASTEKSSNAAWWLIGGAAAGVFGAFLPWVSAGPFSVSGIDGDGQITAILSIITGIIGIVALRSSDQRTSGPGKVFAILLSAVVALVGFYDLGEIGGELDDSIIEVTPGFGLFVTIAGGIIGVVGAARLKKRPKSSDGFETPFVPPAPSA